MILNCSTKNKTYQMKHNLKNLKKKITSMAKMQQSIKFQNFINVWANTGNKSNSTSNGPCKEKSLLQKSVLQKQELESS